MLDIDTIPSNKRKAEVEMTAVYDMVAGRWKENPAADTAEVHDVPSGRHQACRLQLLEHAVANVDLKPSPPALLIDIDQLLG